MKEMRLLGINDAKDYDESFPIRKRTSVRAIIIENNRIYLSHLRRNNTYKLPGGGVDSNEDMMTALNRESEEEVGVSITNPRPYGYYIERWKSKKPTDGDTIWENTSYFFICDRVGEVMPIKPTKSEIIDQCESSLVDINEAIISNMMFLGDKDLNSSSTEATYIRRENEVFNIIKKELIK